MLSNSSAAAWGVIPFASASACNFAAVSGESENCKPFWLLRSSAAVSLCSMRGVRGRWPFNTIVSVVYDVCASLASSFTVMPCLASLCFISSAVMASALYAMANTYASKKFAFSSEKFAFLSFLFSIAKINIDKCIFAMDNSLGAKSSL